MTDRPSWAQRLRRERDARGWSQRDTVRAMRAHADRPLPGEDALLRTWKRWEAGRHVPDGFYQALIAKTLGTVTGALFPPERRVDPLADTGMDAMELVARLRATDVDQATLDALRITADRLCSEYPHQPAERLRAEGLRWLRRITGLLDRRLTLAQHQEVLTVAGWAALLLGCVEYDMGAGQTAEAGQAAAPHHGVAVQLAAQRAKAWARLGDRRQVEVALEQGRALLEAMPQPDNLEHHFVVDPSKFDFYSMDCYRLLGEDRLATMYAEEAIRTGIGWDGVERTPMRIAEARLTLGVAAARAGDLDQAVAYGRSALTGERKSLPHLLMTSSELERLLTERHPAAPKTREYVSQLRQLRRD